MIEEYDKWEIRNEEWEQSYKLTEKYFLVSCQINI